MEKVKRISQLSFKIFSLLPLTWILALYLFTFSCTIELGHFPISSLNDPKGIGLKIFYQIVWFGFFPVFFGSLLWIVNLIVSIFYKTISFKYLMIFIIGMSILLIQVIFDPFQILNWYLD